MRNSQSTNISLQSKRAGSKHIGDRRIASLRDRDTRKRNIAVVVGIVAILMILAIPAYGYYENFIKPPRVLAARVGDVTYSYGDLVKRLRTQQSALRYLGSFVDLSRMPFEILFQMAENQLIIQEGSKLGLSVSDEEIDGAIRIRFFPVIDGAEEVSPGQLEDEFDEQYISFLNSTRLDEDEFRQIVKEDLYRYKLSEEVGKSIPTEEESVEVFWAFFDIGRQQIDFEDKIQRLDRYGFETVIREESIPPYFNNGQGYVGWVPKGAFPSLDNLLFGDKTEGLEPLEHHKISPPMFTQEGAFLAMIVNGPEKREITNSMRIQSEEELVKKWITGEWRTASDEGSLEVNMDSTLYEWIAAQVQESRVRSFGDPSAESLE